MMIEKATTSKMDNMKKRKEEHNQKEKTTSRQSILLKKDTRFFLEIKNSPQLAKAITEAIKKLGGVSC